MVVLAKSNNNEGWGMGFLFIFFHNHPHDHQVQHPPFKRKKPPFSLFSFANLLLSVCSLLVFSTLLLFTHTPFQPTSLLHHHNHPPRRFLHHNSRITPKAPSISTLFSSSSNGSESNFTHIAPPALQGMGVLYLRGSKAMTDLLVGHVTEDVSPKDLTTFLRVIFHHHSGVLSRSDLVLIFPSLSTASRFGPVVQSECDSFLRLVQLGLVKSPGRVNGLGPYEPLWGKRRAGSAELDNSAESAHASYGSVVGFDASELDPEDSLSGFLPLVPMGLRRWASYPMLLGRVRRSFKHMMLVDVKDSLVLSDPFTPVRNRSSESVHLWYTDSVPDTKSTRHHGTRNSSKTRVNPGVIVGGSRGVRRFANAALTEIVRVAVEHKGKGKNSVTESGIVNQLVHSEHLLKNVNLIGPTESIPELSSLVGFNPMNSGFSFLGIAGYFSVVQRGHSGESGSFDVDYVVMKEICSSHKLYSSVYSDCLASQ